MSERAEDNNQETIGQLIFKELTKEIGADVLKKVIEVADREIDGGQQGASLEEDDITLQVVSDRFSFLFHGWGPFEIPRQAALEQLDES